ncbi:anti-sigma regulatory factor [Mycolicibacterium parafortuitum]|uniref:ATP-binding protein n=1 Tax=Mycolicibacterium parafortuitum TaxID=39692 RepID=UPI003A6ED6A0
MSLSAVESPTSEQLTVRGMATAASAAQLRDEFGAWLRARGVSAPQTNEILLAVNEALANCVDHAYTGHSAVGTMAVRADYEPAAGCLSICVTDHGTWRQPGHQSAEDRRRGRGVALMHAMADHCTINGRHDGTTVCLDYRCRGIR